MSQSTIFLSCQDCINTSWVLNLRTMGRLNCLAHGQNTDRVGFKSLTCYSGVQLYHSIRKTCPCNEYPCKPHFYIVKLGFAGVYRGGSNEYPQSVLE